MGYLVEDRDKGHSIAVILFVISLSFIALMVPVCAVLAHVIAIRQAVDTLSRTLGADLEGEC